MSESLLYQLAAVEQELQALRAQLSEKNIGQGEPVAWMSKSGHVQVRTPYLSDEAVNAYSTNGQWTPLYAQPAPQQKPLLQRIDGCSRYPRTQRSE